MHPIRRKRLFIILFVLSIIGCATALVLYALRQNINLFYTPSQVVNGEAPTGVTIRIGGLVKNDSLKQADESLKISFTVTDTEKNIPVEYEGIVPDLFREGQGVVARGELSQERIFIAQEILAKHDENYMPPEVKETLEKKGYWKHSLTTPDD